MVDTSETLTFECSVVKSRLQAGSNEYRSSLHGLLTILKNEGFFGLYKGIASKIIQSMLTAAILFASQRRIFELTKKVLSNFLNFHRLAT
jgi:adenine nucleotide transporter 17